MHLFIYNAVFRILSPFTTYKVTNSAVRWTFSTSCTAVDTYAKYVSYSLLHQYYSFNNRIEFRLPLPTDKCLLYVILKGRLKTFYKPKGIVTERILH